MARETRSGKNSLGTNSSNQTSEHIMEGSSFTQPNPSSGNMRENNGVKKKRGPTAMHKIWVREENTVISLEYNKFGQPIGENKSALHFLGTISRNGKYAPINYGSWTKAPEHFKTNMIQLVKRQFDVPPGKESWIMMSLGKKWRNWKARIKWIHFKAFLPFDTQVRKVPQRLHLDQWSGLLKSWYSDNMQVQSIVSFKSIMNSSEIVAKGVVNNMDPTTKVGGVDLGLNWCEVNVQVPIKWDE